MRHRGIVARPLDGCTRTKKLARLVPGSGHLADRGYNLPLSYPRLPRNRADLCRLAKAIRHSDPRIWHMRCSPAFIGRAVSTGPAAPGTGAGAALRTETAPSEGSM